MEEKEMLYIAKPIVEAALAKLEFSINESNFLQASTANEKFVSNLHIEANTLRYWLAAYEKVFAR